MNLSIKLLLLLPLLVVSACSTKNDVAMNSDYQWAKSHAEQKRLEAITEIAKQGDSGAVAAALLMQQQGAYSAALPSSGSDKALAWAQVLVPSATNAFGIAVNGTVSAIQSNNSKDVAINNSNNGKDVSINTNETMSTIASATIVKPEIVTQPSPSVTCVTDASYECTN